MLIFCAKNGYEKRWLWSEERGGKKSSKDWKDLNDNWWKAVERNMDRKVWVDRASEQVDVGRLKQYERAGGWQPDPSLQW